MTKPSVNGYLNILRVLFVFLKYAGQGWGIHEMVSLGIVLAGLNRV